MTLNDLMRELGITEDNLQMPVCLTNGAAELLGMPNFHCGPRCQYLRARGVDIPRKAEEEQAAWIHINLCAFLAWGDGWRGRLNTAFDQFFAAHPAR